MEPIPPAIFMPFLPLGSAVYTHSNSALNKESAGQSFKVKPRDAVRILKRLKIKRESGKRRSVGRHAGQKLFIHHDILRSEISEG